MPTLADTRFHDTIDIVFDGIRAGKLAPCADPHCRRETSKAFRATSEDKTYSFTYPACNLDHAAEAVWFASREWWVRGKYVPELDPDTTSGNPTAIDADDRITNDSNHAGTTADPRRELTNAQPNAVRQVVSAETFL